MSAHVRICDRRTAAAATAAATATAAEIPTILNDRTCVCVHMCALVQLAEVHVYACVCEFVSGSAAAVRCCAAAVSAVACDCVASRCCHTRIAQSVVSRCRSWIVSRFVDALKLRVRKKQKQQQQYL